MEELSFGKVISSKLTTSSNFLSLRMSLFWDMLFYLHSKAFFVVKKNQLFDYRLSFFSIYMQVKFKRFSKQLANNHLKPLNRRQSFFSCIYFAYVWCTCTKKRVDCLLKRLRCLKRFFFSNLFLIQSDNTKKEIIIQN